MLFLHVHLAMIQDESGLPLYVRTEVLMCTKNKFIKMVKRQTVGIMDGITGTEPCTKKLLLYQLFNLIKADVIYKPYRIF